MLYCMSNDFHRSSYVIRILTIRYCIIMRQIFTQYIVNSMSEESELYFFICDWLCEKCLYTRCLHKRFTFTAYLVSKLVITKILFRNKS